MEDSASCIWVSVTSSTNVKGGIADLALVFWDTMPRRLFLYRPHLLGESMWLALGFCAAILDVLALTSVILFTSLAFHWALQPIPFIFIHVFPLQIVVFSSYYASLVAQVVKNLPAVGETLVQSLGQEDPLE